MKRGEIWLADLEPTWGDEMGKVRPVVIISRHGIGLDLCLAVPATGWQDRFQPAPWMVRVDPAAGNGLTKASAINVFQVRCLSNQRFDLAQGRRKLGRLSDADLQRVLAALRTFLA